MQEIWTNQISQLLCIFFMINSAIGRSFIHWSSSKTYRVQSFESITGKPLTLYQGIISNWIHLRFHLKYSEPCLYICSISCNRIWRFSAFFMVSGTFFVSLLYKSGFQDWPKSIRNLHIAITFMTKCFEILLKISAAILCIPSLLIYQDHPIHHHLR